MRIPPDLQDIESVKDRIIVALDVSEKGLAMDLLEQLRGRVRFVKIGFELFLSFGEGEITLLREQGVKIFFDHKFFDIGRTVKAGVRKVASMGASFVTVHAEPHTMKAAVEGRDESSSECKVLAVTVLTNMQDSDIYAMGFDRSITVRDLVLRRATQALDLGVDGVIASPMEAEVIRSIKGGRDLIIVTPGVREDGDEKGDQKRVSGAKQAVINGSDYIVVGRPILNAKEPVQTFDRYLESLSEGWRVRLIKERKSTHE